MLHNRKDSFKKSGFLRFYLYFRHVIQSSIGLIRGYGGHEMLNEFNLINMNGRVYDPVLGRFLSPDKYVQEGDNSQNYNSYSYCLNNPLKYADPSGNVFVLDDFIAITAMGAIMGTMNAVMSDKPIWRGALLGGVSAAATYGIGSISLSIIRMSMVEAGIHSLTITSTARTPQEQVSAMYYNLKHKNYCKYAPAGQAVESLYPDKEAMLKEVYRQGPGRVSKHCADFNKLNVIDISPSSVSNPRAFHKSLINNVKISRVLDPWTKTKDPVFHIEIPQ